MLSFHVKFVQTDRQTDRQTDNSKTIRPNLSMRGHKKYYHMWVPMLGCLQNVKVFEP